MHRGISKSALACCLYYKKCIPQSQSNQNTREQFKARKRAWNEMNNKIWWLFKDNSESRPHCLFPLGSILGTRVTNLTIRNEHVVFYAKLLKSSWHDAFMRPKTFLHTYPQFFLELQKGIHGCTYIDIF